MANRYYKDTQQTPDYAWDTVANWWTDAACTTPAGALPQAGDTVYLAMDMTVAPTTPVTLTHIYVGHLSTGWTTAVSGFVFLSSDGVSGAMGPATFYATAQNTGYISGHAVFRADSANYTGGNCVTADFYDNAFNGGYVNTTAHFWNASHNEGSIGTGSTSYYHDQSYQTASADSQGAVIFAPSAAIITLGNVLTVGSLKVLTGINGDILGL